MLTRTIVIAVLGLGCGVVDGTQDGVAADEVATRKGIDYAWGRPSIGSLHNGGYTFAARYLSYDATGKNLSAGEAGTLRGNGIDVVVVWEQEAQAALAGYNHGVQHATDARNQAAACGIPDGRPIYFAVDFDASAGDQAAINSYFDGVASVIGRERTGVYAGYYVVKRLFDAGKIRYGWQTYAWSGGQWDGRAQLRQVLNGINVGGVDSDLDDAVADDFGQWGFRGRLGGGRIVAAANADGRVEVFFIAPDATIHHQWERVNGGWSEAALGGSAKSLAVARNADGRLELFYVGTNDRIYHNFQTAPGAPWYGEVPLAGWAKQLAVGTNADGRLEVFYVGTNDKLYHNWQSDLSGHWAGEHALGGAARQIVASENADGREEVFYVGTNDVIYHNFQKAPNGGWYGEVPLAGKAKRLAVARTADDRIELFYIGTNDALYHNVEAQPNGAWSGEEGLGGKAKDLEAGVNADGRVELFYAGTDDAIYHNVQTAPGADTWSGETALGGKALQLAVGTNSDGRLELFYIGTNDANYHNWQTHPNGGWAGEAPF